MAVLATVEIDSGESRKLYIRLNNFEQLANHGVPAIARFRGFVSKAAFEAGKAFVWERLVEFPADAPANPWTLGYQALRTTDNAAEARTALAQIDAALAAGQAALNEIELPPESDESDGAAQTRQRHAAQARVIAALEADRPALAARLARDEALAAALAGAQDA